MSSPTGQRAGGGGASRPCWRGEHLRRRPQAVLFCSWFLHRRKRPRAVESQPSIRAAEDSHSPRATFNCIRRTGPILRDSIHFSKARIRLPVHCSSAWKPAAARPSLDPYVTADNSFCGGGLWPTCPLLPSRSIAHSHTSRCRATAPIACLVRLGVFFFTRS